MKKVVRTVLAGAVLLFALSFAYADSPHPKKHRNAIIFIADGLRPGSVNSTDAPTLLSVRNQGVNFKNSHALFPTFTTPNGSAIATGHYLGDTGDFSNTIYSGYPVFNTGNFGRTPGTNTPFIENNPILADLDDHYNGNYLSEETLLSVARAHGYNTASIGKVGPVAIQDVTQINPVGQAFPTPVTVFIDDATGGTSGIPLPASVVTALTNAGLPLVTPARVQPSGNNATPGTLAPNATQQQYFADATTKAVLPAFKANGSPFVLVYWSRDPDGTQHNQGDSLNTLVPGINGPTSKAGVHNADNNLKQILDYLNSNPDLAANTDIIVTADHGFATISKHDVAPDGTSTSSYAASFIYKDTTGRQEVNTGFLPVGFVAIDLAHALNLPIFDPDSIIAGGSGNVYEPVDPTIPQQTATVRQHPANGDALIGASGNILDNTDAKVIIAANGGSDLIYVPDHDINRTKQIVAFLAKQDYVGGMFLDDSFGRLPGTLPLSSINLVGNTGLPTPTIALAFKTFAIDPNNPLQTAVQIADSGLQQGQGMHGSLGRDNTFNNMAAIGPDFKSNFVDFSPVGNADIVPTLAEILGFQLSSNGDLKGRVIVEALKGGPFAVFFERQALISRKAASGQSTALEFQRVGSRLYFDEACFVRPNPFHIFNPCH
jgi:hypothetical protein